jgi:hypothetical protein
MNHKCANGIPEGCKPNQFLQADPGDSAIKIGLRSSESDPDPQK